MARLRKMLGNINDPVITEFMGLIETQSKETLTKWAVGYVEKHCLPIYEKAYPERGLSDVIAALKEYLKGGKSLKDIKPLLKEANQIAKEAEENPAAQAATRAIATACGVPQTPTNALGFTFYCAAAVVYDKAGLDQKQEIYDALAKQELNSMLNALEQELVADEKNPVKVNWNC